VGQFQNYNRRNKKTKNNWNWYIILLVMIWIGTFVDLLRKTFPDANTVEILTFYGGLFVVLLAVIRWCYFNYYLVAYPFKMRFSDKGPYDIGKPDISKRKIIQYAHHDVGHERVILRIKLKKEMTFEEINIRFVNKKWFGLYYQDVPKNVISIEKIIDPIAERNYKETGRAFSPQDDSLGGQDGYYNPPYFCPKGGYLWYEIKLNINPEIKEWHGYIGFQHRTGGSHRAAEHNEITVRNILI
jgi:hypothetical protein